VEATAMKLATYRTPNSRSRAKFGAVVGDRIVAFADVAPTKTQARGLGSVETYLDGLPDTFTRAKDILAQVADQPDVGVPLDQVRLLAPVPKPSALLDCALSPQHLRDATATLLRRSLPWGIGGLIGPLAGAVVGRPQQAVRHYKGNPHSVIGDNDTIGWPDFTAYLDIEPELGIVTGAIPCGAGHDEIAAAVAGYVIYNDASARDVQLSEMFFTGPSSSKDFDNGNGLGPYLVTPDEIDDPLALNVTVISTGRTPWRGSTAQYTHHPTVVLHQLAQRRGLPAGTVVGMGTVPGCCGLDRDEWIFPGDEISISVEGLGTLRQRVGFPTIAPSTRWQHRRLPTRQAELS
jgi:2-keto-4-pentenoate hydratase/2-oxohepta-3-ene-1,7-dioic acid hydratase in catechol pathway